MGFKYWASLVRKPSLSHKTLNKSPNLVLFHCRSLSSSRARSESSAAKLAAMGRVGTKTVKKSSRQVIEQYYSKMTLDFHTNKRVLGEVSTAPTKRLRNKIAGFSNHLMSRIQKGPVRGISLMLQEEELPDVSAISTDHIEVDKETLGMLSALGMSEVPGLVRVDPVAVQAQPVRLGQAGGAGRRY
ncbi:Ribosomal protein [Parasponia andersonii]|uniref:Ribosomal protein n=1 Tax=Parasponia andersonii TaxID=3476 RepID=A0A2P5B4K7_PARAD|nr:Ribosomal protein [Parasponia andersonii]